MDSADCFRPQRTDAPIAKADVRTLLHLAGDLERPQFRGALYRALLLVLYCTGMRFGEALRLRTRDASVAAPARATNPVSAGGRGDDGVRRSDPFARADRRAGETRDRGELPARRSAFFHDRAPHEVRAAPRWDCGRQPVLWIGIRWPCRLLRATPRAPSGPPAGSVPRSRGCRRSLSAVGSVPLVGHRPRARSCGSAIAAFSGRPRWRRQRLWSCKLRRPSRRHLGTAR